MGISLKALLSVRAEGALAKTNLQPVVVRQCVLYLDVSGLCILILLSTQM